MIHTFLEIYGFREENGTKKEDSAEFWKRCVINLSRFSNSEADISRREKNGQSKERLQKIIKEKFERDFKLKLHGLDHLDYFCIDALHSAQDPFELEIFNDETDRLNDVLLRNSPVRNYANYKKHQDIKRLNKKLERMRTTLNRFQRPEGISG